VDFAQNERMKRLAFSADAALIERALVGALALSTTPPTNIFHFPLDPYVT
jgi:hypothetical protein